MSAHAWADSSVRSGRPGRSSRPDGVVSAAFVAVRLGRGHSVATAADAQRLQRAVGNRASGRLLQRRLKFSGDWEEFHDTVKPHVDMTLTHRAGFVSYTKVGSNPRSPALQALLVKVIDDSEHTASIDFRAGANVQVGSFPEEGPAPNRPQVIHPLHIAAIERGAPGHGIAKIAHELYENYEGVRHARKQPALGPRAVYEHAHAHGGVVEEGKVAKDLAGSGLRRGDRMETVGGEKPGESQRITQVQDFETYFLRYAITHPGHGAAWTVEDVEIVERAEVTQLALPLGGNADEIAAVAALLREHKFSFARVDGPELAVRDFVAAFRQKHRGLEDAIWASGAASAAGALVVSIHKPGDVRPRPARTPAPTAVASPPATATEPPLEDPLALF